jgi:DNA-binding transcriptional regulator YhcF (GntR family)
MATAYGMVNSYSKNVQADVDTYRSFAKDFGANPNQIKSPFENMEKPDELPFTIGNKRIIGKKGKDGAYYVQQGDKFYKVSD